ncbi:hypothetical protein BH23BAC3_BH23BAC3_22390 [soil metagenome]
MREFLQKRTVQAVMVAFVLVIWIYNMNQIMTIQSDTENIREELNLSLVDSTGLNTMSTYNFSYTGNFRDPFLSGIRNDRSPPNPMESSIEETEVSIRPNIQLYGVVEGLAVIKMDGNMIHFMQAGENVDGVRVHKIYSDSVSFMYHQEEFTLNLE